MQIKKIGPLEGELLRHYDSLDSIPVLIFDTGGLIDMAKSLRQYAFSHRNGDRDQRYEKPSVFLRNLSGAFKMIITPKIYQEIQNHGRTRINQHTIELTPRVVDFALEAMIGSRDFIKEVKSQMTLDDARYDAYWAAKYGCNGKHKRNHKKCLEGCSEADKELLSTAVYLGMSPDINPALVVSSDAHILDGLKFLKDNSGDIYSKIIPVSTRE